MSGSHAVDSRGRMLPHAGWPSDRQAPGELELVRRFCNSVNRENDAERFHDATAFEAWLAGEGAPATGATALELERVIEAREALHRLVVANATGAPDDGAWDELGHLLPTAAVGFSVTPGGLVVAPAPGGVDGFLARVGLAVAAAVADGSWGRLKACHHCHWVVYDPSKNRSARWCSMSACGGRQNAKAYRRRRNGRAA